MMIWVRGAIGKLEEEVLRCPEPLFCAALVRRPDQNP